MMWIRGGAEEVRMAGPIESRLAELGLILPDGPPPLANYVPWVRSGGFLYVSGQLPSRSGKIVIGRVGAELGVTQGQEAARLCGLALLAQVRAACGELDSVRQVVKLTGFVNCTADFADHPLVINGASDLMAELFGDAGRHARSAIGVASLPFGAAVEIEGIFAVD